jgi:acyl phosphate:glycerol-3-phosphate acyltransferase
MDALFTATYLIGSYLIGAIPFGFLFGKALGGVDVRAVGSGNIGATNVLRAAGKKAAILTLVADCLKGLSPVLLAATLFPDERISVLSGVAAILGHDFPVYLGFKGGKGVATSFGVVLAVAPGTGLVCLIAWAATAFFWKYSSLSALMAFALYPIVTFAVHGESKPQEFLSLFVFGMIYYRHRENIKRLIAGTEAKIGLKQ